MTPLFSVKDLTVEFATLGGPLKALDAVSFSVDSGETLALVGESGSGKSTAALAALGLLGPDAVVNGSIFVQGRELSQLSERERRLLRGRIVSIVFQDPFTSLNPAQRWRRWACPTRRLFSTPIRISCLEACSSGF